MQNIKIEISLKEHVENMSFIEQFELIRYLISDCASNEEYKQILKWIFISRKEAEIEFENREEIINAYNTLIKSIE